MQVKRIGFSNKKKNPRYGRRTGTEFESIRKQMPNWIDEALTEIEEKNFSN